MNATELAEYLDENVEAMYACEQVHIDEAATMLRQLQDERDKLFLAHAHEMARADIAQMEIEKFKKKIQNQALDLLTAHAQADDHWVDLNQLKTVVRSFFEDFLNVREESDSGRVFAPITLSSTRCMMIDPLCDILQKMRKLSGAADAPEMESRND
jgi:hypothetical protein